VFVTVVTQKLDNRVKKNKQPGRKKCKMKVAVVEALFMSAKEACVVCGVCVYTDAVPLSVAFLRTFMAYSWLLSGGVTFRTKNTCAHIKKHVFTTQYSYIV